MSDSIIEVMNPVANADRGEIAPPARLRTLEGKTIALWWNTKAKGDVALRKVGQLLEERFGAKTVFFHQDFPHKEDVYDRVAKSGCAAAVISTAD